jgi:hypothetical protein
MGATCSYRATASPRGTPCCSGATGSGSRTSGRDAPWSTAAPEPQRVRAAPGLSQRNVMVGDARVPLTSPEISKLFLDRSSLAVQPAGVIVVGRDPARSHAIVAHPTVSGAHLRVDVNARTVTDLGSKSGTFDRNSQRLTANQPVPMDVAGGYSLGAVWVPTSVLMECAGATPGGRGDPMGAGILDLPGRRPGPRCPFTCRRRCRPCRRCRAGTGSMQGGTPRCRAGQPSMQGHQGAPQGHASIAGRAAGRARRSARCSAPSTCRAGARPSR